MSGKVAIITGASRGIGRETALLLAENGFRLSLAARQLDPLQRTGEEICTAGGEVITLPTDVSDESHVERLFSETLSAFGRLDALINNAGSSAFEYIHESSTEEWDRVIDTNLKGIYLCCKHALRPMLFQGSGHIVNVLSIAARVPFPGSAAYCASKFGALGLTKVITEEVRKKGIRVTALLPGAVSTPFWDHIESKPDTGRMIPPRRVAEAILFLLTQPEGVTTDEMVIMPPEGIL